MKAIVSNAVILGIFFLSLFVIGLIGNTLLLVLQINTLLFQLRTKKPIDWILMHLTLANILKIVCTGIPEIIHSFGIRNFLDDAGCKAVLYIYRVTRGLSLCTMSFLSIFQAVMITPSNSRWAWLKPKISTCVFPALFVFYISNMLIYIRVIITTVSPYNTTEAVKSYTVTYCSGRDSDKLGTAVFLGIMAIEDALCVFLMIWTSVYMVRLLFTHRRTVQHIHKKSLCPRASPETKATRMILVLLSCFAVFYWTNSCLTIYISYRHDVQGLENITVLFASCYPAICPFVLIKNKNRKPLLTCAFEKMNKSSPEFPSKA
nr:vomeronasal type-1 receptor 4-like [Manis javanica]